MTSVSCSTLTLPRRSLVMGRCSMGGGNRVRSGHGKGAGSRSHSSVGGAGKSSRSSRRGKDSVNPRKGRRGTDPPSSPDDSPSDSDDDSNDEDDASDDDSWDQLEDDSDDEIERKLLEIQARRDAKKGGKRMSGMHQKGSVPAGSRTKSVRRAEQRRAKGMLELAGVVDMKEMAVLRSEVGVMREEMAALRKGGGTNAMLIAGVLSSSSVPDPARRLHRHD